MSGSEVSFSADRVGANICYSSARLDGAAILSLFLCTGDPEDLSRSKGQRAKDNLLDTHYSGHWATSDLYISLLMQISSSIGLASRMIYSVLGIGFRKFSEVKGHRPQANIAYLII